MDGDEMFIEPHPFPYLRQDQYAGRGLGEIIFLDPEIPEDQKEWLRKEYKIWWEERTEERFRKEET